MILGGNKDQVIENIRAAAARGDWNVKVEVNDPDITEAAKASLVRGFWEKKDGAGYAVCNRCARIIENTAAGLFNRHTRIEGLENLDGITGGAVITSNHFSPLDNTALLTMVKKTGRRRMYIVCQDNNYATPGLVGFLMNYADTIPLWADPTYLATTFLQHLQKLLSAGNWVLMYPEQEMWFNYRKPRPCRRGPYYYAAKCGVPVISCFVEIEDLPAMEKGRDDFHQVRYILHVLPPVWPEAGRSVRLSSVAMMEQDSRQKQAAYERAYGKPLTYDFQVNDIAGWIQAGDRRKEGME